MRRKPYRTFVIVGGLTILLFLLGWRGYRDFVPAGARPIAYLFHSVPGPISTSPDGKTVLAVTFNYAGAMHSGTSHWTWITTDNWVTGKRVVAEGYVDAAIRRGEEPLFLEWVDRSTFQVRFLEGRRSADEKELVVRLE